MEARTKKQFLKLKIFQIEVYDSVAHFNFGNTPYLWCSWYRQELNELWTGVSTMMYLELKKTDGCYVD